MLEVKGIKEGIVIDHIKAGNGLKLFNLLMLEYINCPIVLVMNVDSKNLEKKDIIKIEDKFDLDLDKLGLIDSNITVNIIKNNKVIDKKNVTIPKKVKGTFKCSNPRCITNSDDYISPSFKLIDSKGTPEYLCEYCEEITKYDGYLLNK
ncbi:aspartate carbamoyltransferase regulatory subunit [Helicovermis profundi]|uniref:Aspartate carbamoyltransferase regulatory subunit n=1 Tax=Helicovermis profundi TaxID=3065157 RepID=A0AAU9E6H6_9FIRM|nr:aspartate carbamoyltransferase regulatory subunit [Clostridia bacterium S502]